MKPPLLSTLSSLPSDLLPGTFYLGTAMAAYQIEGAVREGGRGESVWDAFCREPGRIKDGSSGDVACDHYHRWEEDLDIMAALGIQAYRLSISWTRILPDGTGAINEEGLAYYDRVIDGLVARGIRPMVMLYHWDLPVSLWRQHGGWLGRETAYALADYARVCFDRYGDRVRDWFVLNEPAKIHAVGGYDTGVHAPGHRGGFCGRMAAAHHQLLAFALAKQAFRGAGSPGRIGYGEAFNDIRACIPSPSGELLEAARHFEFGQWADMFRSGTYRLAEENPAVAACLPETWQADGKMIREEWPDMLGINYYTPGWVRADAGNPFGWSQGEAPEGAVTWRNGLQWPIDPLGLERVLHGVAREFPGVPLLVSENGFCDECAPGAVGARDEIPDDPDRETFITSHLEAVGRAIAAGVPVEGYLYWSLLDNFEWSKGYGPRFGLVGVDYKTQRRVVKRSGTVYAAYIKGRTLTSPCQEGGRTSPAAGPRQFR